jgi:hypothetical protein
MGFALFSAQWHLHNFWLGSSISFFFTSAPNAFDVLSNHVGFVIVCSASCHPTINDDGLVNTTVVVHDLCITNMLLSLYLPDISPIEKSSKKKGARMGSQLRVSK